jgi:class 3 adenylate cyclase
MLLPRRKLPLGDTPHIAARLQALAVADTVVMSETTARLVHGYFVCQPLGMQGLTEFAQPLMVYWVLRESEAHSRVDVAYPHALPPWSGGSRRSASCWSAGPK